MPFKLAFLAALAAVAAPCLALAAPIPAYPPATLPLNSHPVTMPANQGSGPTARTVQVSDTNLANEVLQAPGGTVFGAATGGPQGNGTINAQGLYVNGVPVSGGGGAVCGSTLQLQFNLAASCGATSSLRVGLDTTHQGLLVSGTNPNASGEATDTTLGRFTATSSALAASSGFTNINGLEVYQNSTFGYNAEATGPPAVQAKSSFETLSIFAQHAGDGQMIGLADTIYCYGGQGDCGAHSEQLLSSGVESQGGEGNTSVFDSHQQDYRLVTTTILQVLSTTTCSTTITSGLSGSNVDQTFTVGSTSGCNVGDWVRINEQAPNNQNTVQAAQIDAVGASTLTAIVYYPTPAGATVLPAQVLKLNTSVGPTTQWGQNRVIVCTSCSAVTAGTTVLDANGFTVDGTSTNFTTSMVNGDALNPGVFEFNADTWTGGPIATTFVSYYQISAVTNTTHLNIYKTDVAGSSGVITKCVSSCTYKVLPGAAMLLLGDGTRLPSNEVVMDGPPSMWTGLASQTVTERIGPFSDVSFSLNEVGCWTNGCIFRGGAFYRNEGGRTGNAGITIDTSGYIGTSGADTIAWTTGVNIQSSVTGVQITGGVGSLNGVFAQSLTGNGFGFQAANVTGGNSGSGLILQGWGTALNLDAAPTLMSIGGSRLMSGTAPTISSGFGTAASVAIQNGTTAFLISVGTSNTGQGVIGLPTAAHGWVCWVVDKDTTSATVFVTKQINYSTTSCTVQNYSDAAATHAWVDNDILAVSAFAF